MKNLIGLFLGILFLGILFLGSLVSISYTNSIEASYDDSIELRKELKSKIKDWSPEKVEDFKQFCWNLKRLSRGDLIVLEHNYFYSIKPQAVIYKVINKSPSGIILKENNRFKSQLYILKIWPASKLIRVYDSTVSIIIRKNKARLYMAELF